jgi:hypothetical protein
VFNQEYQRVKEKIERGENIESLERFIDCTIVTKGEENWLERMIEILQCMKQKGEKY